MTWRSAYWCVLMHVVFVVLGQEFVQGLPENVRICSLFEPHDDKLESAFLNAIDRVNSRKELPRRSKLTAEVANLVLDDSFHVTKKVCQMLRLGVAAIFGPQSAVSSPSVRSIAAKYEIPHLETRWDFRFGRHPHFSLNFHPHPAAVSRAIFDLVNNWGWKTFSIIYEDDQGLVRLQELLKGNYKLKPRQFIRQMDPGDDYRTLLKALRSATQYRIVVDCSTDRIKPILEQANAMGLMNSYYHYFFTSLDFHTVDLDEFRNTFANITGIRLVKEEDVKQNYNFEMIYHSKNPRSGKMMTEVALIHDAVKVFTRALRDIDDSSKSVDIQAMDCNSTGTTWMYGNSIVQRMKQLKTVDGFTGRIMFDEDGFRTNFSLDIISLRVEKGDIQAIGTWSSHTGVNIMRAVEQDDENKKRTMVNKHYRVTTKINEPYVMEKPGVGNDRFYGYSIDLIEEIAVYLKFNYTVHITPTKGYGAWLKDAQEFTDGVFKELVDHRADIGIGDLAITLDRELGVDFTMPFMNLGITILFKRPSKEDPDLFSFLSPLSVDVWLYMATAYLGVSVVLFLLARFNPYDWENPHPCDPDPDELENKFGLLNSMWFTIGSLMQQGSDLAPKAVSTRLVAGIWWFFTLIMISSYTANLAAFLTVQRMEPAIKSVNDLASQSTIKYGCYYGGATYNFFKESSMTIYQNMFMAMETASPPVYIMDGEDGVARVKKGGYAYLIESTSSEYNRERDSDLVQIGGLLDSKSYGIAVPPGAWYRPELNSAILHLQDSGRLRELKKKWWVTNGGGKLSSDVAAVGASASELGLTNVGGVFVVLLGGMAMACVVGIVEFVWKTRKAVREERRDFWDEVKREIRFAMKVGSSKKPIIRKVDTKDQMSLPLTNYS